MEQNSDKNLQPTEKKLQKAREKGQIPRSSDLNFAFCLVGFYISFAFLNEYLLDQVGTHLVEHIRLNVAEPALLLSANGDAGEYAHLANIVFLTAGIFVIPFVMIFVSILGQRSLTFSLSKITPKLSKISPIDNAKQKYGINGLIEFAKSFVKLSLFSALIALFLYLFSDTMIGLSYHTARFSLHELSSILNTLLLVAIVLSFLLAVPDLIYQNFKHRRDNMMSYQELKEELKEDEGDPQFNQIRRQKAQNIALNTAISTVPSAQVLIVNPTHYAVALKWERSEMQAPVVLCKGVDQIAARMRELALQHAVPIYSDPPTARYMYSHTEVGSEIQPELYAAVAAAIRFSEGISEPHA